MTELLTDEEIEGLPPSAKFVLWILEDEGELTQQELNEQITLPSRTVRWALNRLEDEEIIESRPYTGDARKSVYTISGTDTSDT
ncbi:MarR family transcriptional regulator [Natrinema halophilum]|uniref:Winged helix-turn-helix domain-containing protein n=1 Tax=Natrinema halophilum TaxID=1699371 RepID=A0A7D5GQP2_9EURY|nr:helix-turn-helix domain-containing protein [Natrinema halophilum]QLG47909.1 winged helix-turn-helix domain-containing protein [Natrinema halophilum]